METKLNVDLKTIVIIAVLLIVGFGGGFKWMNNRFKDVSAQLEQQTIIAQAATGRHQAGSSRTGTSGRRKTH